MARHPWLQIVTHCRHICTFLFNTTDIPRIRCSGIFLTSSRSYTIRDKCTKKHLSSDCSKTVSKAIVWCNLAQLVRYLIIHIHLGRSCRTLTRHAELLLFCHRRRLRLLRQYRSIGYSTVAYLPYTTTTVTTFVRPQASQSGDDRSLGDYSLEWVDTETRTLRVTARRWVTVQGRRAGARCAARAAGWRHAT